MALSMSVSAGAHNARHNTDLAYRANLRNVDADLSVGNISIRDVPIAEAYETVFGDSLRAHNAKQKSRGGQKLLTADAPLLSRSSSPTGTVGRMRTVGNMRRSLTITSGTTS